VRITAGRLLTAADLAATFLFAVEGAPSRAEIVDLLSNSRLVGST